MAIVVPGDGSAVTIRQLVVDASNSGDEVLLLASPGFDLEVGSEVERMPAVVRSWAAGIVYADAHLGSRNDYQAGSIRDDFDFGPLVAISVPAALAAWDRHGFDERLRWGGFYDLRLKMSMDAPIVRIPEPLYASSDPDSRSSGQKQFDYLGPGARQYQLEMERIATAHLKRIGAFLPRREAPSPANDRTPIQASVVIPVRNRERTIGDAVASALDQVADFSFNVVVIDNHSVDRTARVLEGIADSRLRVRVPSRTDLGIGGCWQEAITMAECGRYALQLDSDDVLADSSVLARVVDRMKSERLVMLVGSYTTVDFALDPVAPGLVDHTEWTAENGHNNVLRVNGFGAPRAYDVGVVRDLGFPNVSYGEDYAVGLRVSREYPIGRIYDSLYLCRRWEGNTDSSPTPAEFNRFNAYKDWLRTAEIRSRIRMNGRSG
jgi:GT2 family glycosyltransferase